MSFYTYVLSDIPGVAAADHRFTSLLNPPGSTVTAILQGIHFSECAVGQITSLSAKKFALITAATDGVVVPISEVLKMDSTYPDPQSVLRTENPTVTFGALLASICPASQAPIGVGTHSFFHWAADRIKGLVLYPGEGLAFFQTMAGDTDERINMSLEWEES